LYLGVRKSIGLMVMRVGRNSMTSLGDETNRRGQANGPELNVFILVHLYFFIFIAPTTTSTSSCGRSHISFLISVETDMNSSVATGILRKNERPSPCQKLSQK
jgi:hypothetical protein